MSFLNAVLLILILGFKDSVTLPRPNALSLPPSTGGRANPTRPRRLRLILRSAPIPSEVLQSPTAYQAFLNSRIPPNSTTLRPVKALERFQFSFRQTVNKLGVSEDEVMAPPALSAAESAADDTSALLNGVTSQAPEASTPPKVPLFTDTALVDSAVSDSSSQTSGPLVHSLVDFPRIEPSPASESLVLALPALSLSQSLVLIPEYDVTPSINIGPSENSTTPLVSPPLQQSVPTVMWDELVRTLLTTVEAQVQEAIAIGSAQVAGIQDRISSFESALQESQQRFHSSTQKIDGVQETMVSTVQELANLGFKSRDLATLGHANAALVAEHSRISTLLEERLESLTILINSTIKKEGEPAEKIIEPTSTDSFVTAAATSFVEQVSTFDARLQLLERSIAAQGASPHADLNVPVNDLTPAGPEQKQEGMDSLVRSLGCVSMSDYDPLCGLKRKAARENYLSMGTIPVRSLKVRMFRMQFCCALLIP